FGQYTTDILAMIEEGNRVSGKMRFHGYHQQEIFGVAPSGRHVWWIGMPIFIFDGPKVRDLYVLGDILWPNPSVEGARLKSARPLSRALMGLSGIPLCSTNVRFRGKSGHSF